jgi:hypothetical protein
MTEESGSDPGRDNRFAFLHSLHIDPGAHSLSYGMGTGGGG